MHTIDKLLCQLTLLEHFKQVFQNIIKIRLIEVADYTLKLNNFKIDLHFFRLRKIPCN